MSTIGQDTLESLASAMATNGMLAANYVFFNLDDGIIASRDGNGAMIASQPAFPSGTLKPLADFVNNLGLSLGAYTDRGTTTCENRPGAYGYEAQDAATWIEWGVRWLKEDSCSSSQSIANATRDYGAMSEGLKATGVDVFFSLCGWWSGYASFSGLSPPIGNAWRIGTDVPTWSRFLVNVEAASSVAAFTGPGKGWPDVDMIGGDWSAVEEIAHVCFIAMIGSPLLLSFDIRQANSTSTLGLAAYLNPELLAIHSDDPAPSVAARGLYYSRVSGGSLTGPQHTDAEPAAQVDTGASCADERAQWLFTPSQQYPGFGSLEAVTMPGFCLGLWDYWTGACIDALGAQLIPCNSTNLGCPLSAQLWTPSSVSNGSTLSVALVEGGGTPLPGPYLSANTGVPSALYVQERLTGLSQSWLTNITGGSGGGSTQTILQSAETGACLAPPSQLSTTNVWARWLANGDIALFFINVSPTAAATVTCDAVCFTLATGGSTDTAWTARDVWERTTLPGIINATLGFTTPTPLPAGGGSLLLRLSPTS